MYGDNPFSSLSRGRVRERDGERGREMEREGGRGRERGMERERCIKIGEYESNGEKRVKILERREE